MPCSLSSGVLLFLEKNSFGVEIKWNSAVPEPLQYKLVAVRSRAGVKRATEPRESVFTRRRSERESAASTSGRDE